MTEDWGNFDLNENADIDTSLIELRRGDRERGRSPWPAAIVACAVLLLIGGIAVVALLRWGFQQAKDVLDVLSPLAGVVIGASMTYFLMRAAAGQAPLARQSRTDRLAESLEREIERTTRLHNALTAAMAHLDPAVTRELLRDPTIRSAFRR